jgi:hypothetical protein
LCSVQLRPNIRLNNLDDGHRELALYLEVNTPHIKLN